MAITVYQQPDSFSPVYNPLNFVVSSSNASQPNFQYVFDLYIGGALISRHRNPPNPSNGLGKFNPQRQLESYVTYDIFASLISLGTNANSFVKFEVHFGEEYDVSGVKTLFAGLSTSNSIYAINAVLEKNEFIDYTSSTYVLGSGSKRFLTNSPDIKIDLNQRAWLYSINNGPTAVTIIRVAVYDAAGSATTHDITAALPNTDLNRFLRVPAGTLNMTTLFGLPNMFSGKSYYTVQIHGSGGPLSEAKKFILNDKCSPYETVRLHFLNKLGGFDPFNFTRVSRPSSPIERSEYKRPSGEFSGNSYIYTKAEQSTVTSSTTYRDKLIINSDWITEQESAWLKELVTSPLVYQETPDGDLIPVKINDSVYEPKKRINDIIFNLRIELEYPNVNFRQRF